MLNIHHKSAFNTFITAHTSSMTVEQTRTYLSFMFGYYVGQSMKTTSDQPTHQAAFNEQWAHFEPYMVALNELRPMDFGVARSTAANLFIARSRVTVGGLANLFLSHTQASLLDFRAVSKHILDREVSTEEVTLFFTTLNQICPRPDVE